MLSPRLALTWAMRHAFDCFSSTAFVGMVKVALLNRQPQMIRVCGVIFCTTYTVFLSCHSVFVYVHKTREQLIRGLGPVSVNITSALSAKILHRPFDGVLLLTATAAAAVAAQRRPADTRRRRKPFVSRGFLSHVRH